MRPRLLIALACALFAFTGAAGATQNDGVALRVEGEGWGAADKADIEAALRSVATLLLPPSARALGGAVAVSHGERSPVVLYERGPGGEYQVLLHARDANWHLYVYEFAHEFCHIASNFDRHAGDAPRRNQWFEEALCETASLYALRTLAERWQAAPPTPRLAGAGRQLRWFYELLTAEEHRRPGATGFATWLAEQQEELRRDPYRRAQNELVATRLLPLFASEPAPWDALRTLNLDPADRDCSLPEYLDHWYRNAAAGHKGVVAAVRAALLAEAPTRLAAGDARRHAPLAWLPEAN